MEKINIQIDKPCSENFKTFKKTETGGFCNSCKKSVVDFTKMNDQEIFNHFNTEKSKTCGLFLESQLKSYSNPSISQNGKKSFSFASSIFGLSLVSILSLTNAYSQEKTNTSTIKQENVVSKNKINPSDKNETFRITGTISDKMGPLSGATIYLKNYNISTQSDSNGKFTFPKELENGDVLLFSNLGYNGKEIKVTNTNQSATINYNVKLENAQVIMLGEVATNKVYKSKRSVFQKIKSLFTND